MEFTKYFGRVLTVLAPNTVNNVWFYPNTRFRQPGRARGVHNSEIIRWRMVGNAEGAPHASFHRIWRAL